MSSLRLMDRNQGLTRRQREAVAAVEAIEVDVVVIRMIIAVQCTCKTFLPLLISSPTTGSAIKDRKMRTKVSIRQYLINILNQMLHLNMKNKNIQGQSNLQTKKISEEIEVEEEDRVLISQIKKNLIEEEVVIEDEAEEEAMGDQKAQVTVIKSPMTFSIRENKKKESLNNWDKAVDTLQVIWLIKYKMIRIRNKRKAFQDPLNMQYLILIHHNAIIRSKKRLNMLIKIKMKIHTKMIKPRSNTTFKIS